MPEARTRNIQLQSRQWCKLPSFFVWMQYARLLVVTETRPISGVLMQERQQTGTLIKKTARPMIVQYAPSALPTVHRKAIHSILDNTAKPEQTPKRATSHKSQDCKRPATPESKSSKSSSQIMEYHVVSLKSLHDFSAVDAVLYFKTRPTYYLKASHGITTTVMQTAKCLHDTKAGVNLIRSSNIVINWAYRIKLDRLPTVSTATKQMPPPARLISVNLHIGNLKTQFGFGIAPQLAVDTLLGRA